MQPTSPRKIYLLCALGVLIGVVLLVWLDGAFMVFAAGPIGWSVGVALRTWWKRHGWNPGITVVEDGPAGDASIDDHRK